MKRILIVQPPLPKKEEAISTDVFNLSQEFSMIAELIKNTFSSLEQKISFLDSKINSVSHICSSILETTESYFKGNKTIVQNSCKCCEKLSQKLENFHKIFSGFTDVIQLLSAESLSQKQSLNQDVFSAPVILVPNKVPPLVEAQVSLDSSFQLISLNCEQDYPEGSWLGDDSQAESRVRVPITSGELLHINTHCLTPEKMALTLLDHLFPREILAISNLTGKGKHGKRQLDPLFIYGIRCHLLHKFGINEKDWFRIKQNMDSKCRTVWRRKIKGMPIGTNKADQGYKRKYEMNMETNSLLNNSFLDDNSLMFTDNLVSINEIMEDIEEEDEEEETEIVQIAQGMLQTNFETGTEFTTADTNDKFFSHEYNKNCMRKMVRDDDLNCDEDIALNLLDTDVVLHSNSPLSDHEFIVS